ncbi:MAG: agmatine deiminase family protein [Muribaculaceae bacterium]|nr:agmatine deiminase family protein [Muribaculaceae bacterium]
MKDLRFLAEWEPQGAILMALPHQATDWNYILAEVRECYSRILEALTAEGINVVLLAASRDDANEIVESLDNPDKVRIIECVFNDTWTRDYGPLAVERGERSRALDFGFNGWGLKFAADKDNLVNLHLRDKYVILPEQYRNERDFELEGGSIETDGHGTLLTTTRCLTSPNRNGGKSKSEIALILKERLGVDHILWLDYGGLAGDDTDSHIDTLARMAPNNVILFTGCRDVDDEHFEELLKMRAQLTLFRNPEGEPYNLVELPLPDPIYDDDGMRLPATYANYLVTDRAIFLPTYNQPAKDQLAEMTLRIAFPDHKIVGVDCRALIKQHGSLHCATMQLHPGFFNDALFD